MGGKRTRREPVNAVPMAAKVGRHDPRCFALAIQWQRGGLAFQKDGLTFDEAVEGWRGYMDAPHPPARCRIALVER